ncbi:MAG TPA: hypothetical protein VIT45_04720 [Allosphingosinicella sp.]
MSNHRSKAMDEQIGQRSALIRELYEWQTPDEMRDRVDRLAHILGNDSMQRVGKPFREAWVANRFARRGGYDAVRLLHENDVGTTPDFAVRVGQEQRRFETTEADVPGRRRQAEFRDPSQGGVQPMVFTSLTVMVAHIQALVTKKAAKRYDDCAGLIIHMNPPMFSFEPRFRTEQFLEATAPAAASFREVWLLRDLGVLLWKDGKPADKVPDDF